MVNISLKVVELECCQNVAMWLQRESGLSLLSYKNIITSSLVHIAGMLCSIIVTNLPEFYNDNWKYNVKIN